MKSELIPWKWIQEAVQEMFDKETSRLDYKSKLVEVKVYAVGESGVIRIDVKEVKQ